jgi:hypothetical protein
MHFAGEQIRKRIGPYGKGNGLQEITGLGFETGRWIGIHFQSDFHQLSLWNGFENLVFRLDDDELFPCIAFEKSGLYGLNHFYHY